MIWLFITAFAGGPPSSTFVEDHYDWWENGYESMTQGQKGCWKIEGTSQLTLSTYSPPSMWRSASTGTRVSTGRLEGTLVNGRWTRLEVYIDGAYEEDVPLEKSIHSDLFVLFGDSNDDIYNQEQAATHEQSQDSETDPNNKEEATSSENQKKKKKEASISIETDDLLGQSTSTAYPAWLSERDGVEVQLDVVLQNVPGITGAELSTVLFFPSGRQVPSELDGRLPPTVTLNLGKLVSSGDLPFPKWFLPKATLKDGQIHLRGLPHEDYVLPLAESGSFVFGMMGYTMGMEHRVDYTKAVACSMPAPE